MSHFPSYYTTDDIFEHIWTCSFKCNDTFLYPSWGTSLWEVGYVLSSKCLHMLIRMHRIYPGGILPVVVSRQSSDTSLTNSDVQIKMAAMMEIWPGSNSLRTF